MRGRRSPKLQSRYRVTGGTLVIDLGRTMRVLSSAPCGGGLRSARYIVNHQVEADPISSPVSTETGAGCGAGHDDPSTTLRLVASRLGVNEPCVGLMTAVPMTQLVTSRDELNGLWVECFATVGVTNAVRAGEPCTSVPLHAGAKKVGTINIILITNAALSVSAMVGAVQVVTESKTGVLRDHAVPCWTGRPGATGTGTDAVVIAGAVRGEGERTPYSGTHTEVGGMLGRVVAHCIIEGLDRAKRWSEGISDGS